ncbi:hypothetical protein U1Q18_033715 [Sarracenia purpurea var. burkii]
MASTNSLRCLLRPVPSIKPIKLQFKLKPIKLLVLLINQLLPLSFATAPTSSLSSFWPISPVTQLPQQPPRLPPQSTAQPPQSHALSSRSIARPSLSTVLSSQLPLGPTQSPAPLRSAPLLVYSRRSAA